MEIYPSDDVFESEDTFLTDEDEDISRDEIQPTKTFRLDRNNGRIVGQIDEVEALEQFIMKALRTARNRYLIYDDQYGNELEDFIGQDKSLSLAVSEIPRLIREALIYDDRIYNVLSTVTEVQGDKVYVDVKVDSVYGDVRNEIVI